MIFSRYQYSLNSMVLSEDNVRKVVQNRVCSVAIHPSESLTFVAAGDKYGHIGLWNVVSPLRAPRLAEVFVAGWARVGHRLECPFLGLQRCFVLIFCR